MVDTKGLSDSIVTNCYYRAGCSVNMSFVDDHDCDNCNEIAGVGQRPECGMVHGLKFDKYCSSTHKL